MKKISILALLSLVILFSCSNPSEKPEDQNPKVEAAKKKEWSIVLHGGAGYMTPENMDGEREQAYRAHLDTALSIGEEVLKNGGSSLDAVEQTINYLEDCPLFNAGRGAVLTSDGKAEMDASIMWGKDRNCGAVTGIGNVKNPISAARKVMEESDHVFFSGSGAEIFAEDQNLELRDNSYFITKDKSDRYERIKKEKEAEANGETAEIPKSFKFGTVGCAALDKDGNITAATSTGGMMWKKHGRIGDSPVVGAGTYADNRTCGISCTGHGEYFIRAAVAHEISARMLHGEETLQEAADAVVMKELVEMGGDGGIIGVDYLGNAVMSFNTSGMFRGFSDSDGARGVMIFKNE
ncbi:isoaspartyl peptidase/L-asparaginase family protein [Halocola ammonii]